jgi:hypothetical protein
VAQVELDLATYAGRLTDAVAIAQDLQSRARARHDPAVEMLAALSAGLVRSYAGDREGAEDAVAATRDLEREVRSQTLSAWADYLEGEVELDRDPVGAARLLDRAVATARQANAAFVEGVAGVSSAAARLALGDVAGSRRRYREVIRHWLSIGDWIHQWVTLRNVALLLEHEADPEGAALLLAATASRQRPSYGDEALRLRAMQARLERTLGPEGYAVLERDAGRLEDRDVAQMALDRLSG